MSTHPNVILMASLKPDGLSRKTMRKILVEAYSGQDGDVMISGIRYHSLIMESNYNEGYQISADEGDLVFFNMVTYGYGENVKWSDLEEQKQLLEEWSSNICNLHDCTYKIYVTANYW